MRCSQCICSLKLVKNHFSIQFSCEPLNVMNAHSSKCFRFTFHLQSAHFSYPAPSVAREFRKMTQNRFRTTTAQGNLHISCCPQKAGNTVVADSVRCDFREGRVPSNNAGGFGNPFSQLQLVFGSCGDGRFGAFSKFPSFLHPALLYVCCQSSQR